MIDGWTDGRTQTAARRDQESCGGPIALLCHGSLGTGGRRRHIELKGMETSADEAVVQMKAWGLSEPIEEGHREALVQQRQLSVGIARVVC